MLRQDLKDLKTGPRELRNFGLLVGAVFAALGLFFLLRGKPIASYLLAPGLALVIAGALFPRALKYLYLPWMTLALILGFILAHVILTLFFFLVVTPIGLLSRLVGKDFLRQKIDPKTSTYWLPRPPPSPPHDYEQQF